MYCPRQTLAHKQTKELVCLTGYMRGTGRKVVLIDVNGVYREDDLDNYTHIDDEFGRPYTKQPRENEHVNTEAAKYLVGKDELLNLRRNSLIAWEKRILDRMNGINMKQCDVAHKYVLCPFSDGSFCPPVRDYFLKNRNAKPLFRRYDPVRKEWVDGAVVFKHTDNQMWMYDSGLNALYVITDLAIKQPMERQ